MYLKKNVDHLGTFSGRHKHIHIYINIHIYIYSYIYIFIYIHTHTYPQTAGPEYKKMVTKHAKYSIR